MDWAVWYPAAMFGRTLPSPSDPTSRPPLRLPGISRPGLSEDLLREASQRLQVSALVGIALWAISFVLETWILPFIRGEPPHYSRTPHILCLTGVLFSLGVYFVARRGSLSPQRLLDLGLFYFLGATSALVGRLNANDYLQDGQLIVHSPTWICILILIGPIMVPNTPRRVLVASMFAATMDPLFFYGAVWWKSQTLLPLVNILFWWPNYACAALAVLPARLLERLNRRVQRARELGSYQLVELIGHGGMGEVWKAQHQMLARPAAIKIIRPAALGGEFSAACDTLRRFEREAQATAALQSPHTIEIFDFGIERDGSFYYVMELLHGFDLDTLVRRFGPLPSERVVQLLVQACHSLEDAHQNHLVHRDVKPANIFTCRKGQDFDFLKLLDFGLVKTGGTTVDALSLATLQGTAPGTPGFMAPEQLLGEKDVDHRVDLYALGCVGYWLLTGKLVFEAETTMKMLVAHVQEAPVPPSRKSELPISSDLENVLLACLEKKPDRRPASARELSQQLRASRTDAPWDEERARAWWSKHAPEIASGTTARPSLTPVTSR